MKLLYLWVNNYRNIDKIGFNLSSKAEFFSEVKDVRSDGTIVMDLDFTYYQNLEIFPENIFDIKAVVGENGSGKSNLLFYLMNFLMNKSSHSINGFLVTSEYIFIRDKIEFEKLPSKIFDKELQVVYNNDIVNFLRSEYKQKVTREQAEDMRSDNLMETYFKEDYLIFYSNILNQDNYFNSEGLKNSYTLWENQIANFFDISTEGLIVQDYQSHSNGPGGFISGESELLSYKYLESIRALNFISSEEANKVSVQFPINRIYVHFNDFNKRFWESIDMFFAPNNPAQGLIQNKIFEQRDKIKETRSEQAFFNELSIEVLFCLLSYELTDFYNFSSEEEFPLVNLLKQFDEIYNPSLDPLDALFNYIENARSYKEQASQIKEQIKNLYQYFERQFQSHGLVCDGIYGFFIPEQSIKALITDFTTAPLYGINIKKGSVQDIIRMNFFGFDFYGLSSGERSFLSIFSRLKYIKHNLVNKNRDILFLIDEGEIGFHPQWQKQYLKTLLDFTKEYLKDFKVQFIITSHSPFLASDLPNQNIIFLESQNRKTKISGLSNHSQTFASNIHSLYTDAFFLREAMIGDFARSIVNEIIEYLRNKEPSKEKTEKYRPLLALIGEPVIRHKIEEMWLEKFGKEEEIIVLRKRLEDLGAL